jgi:hypothetical protein
MTAPLPGLSEWPLAPRPYYFSFEGHRRGRWLMYGQTRRAVVFIDLAAWPPAPILITEEYAISFDVLPDGRLILCSHLTGPEESGYRLRLHAAGWPERGGPTLVTADTDFTGEALTFGDTVLAVPWIGKELPEDQRRPHLLQDRHLVPVEELPLATRFDESGWYELKCGKVTLGSGVELLVWDGVGYERDGGRFRPAWDLALRSSHISWTAVPWGEEGFFYLSDRRVWYARRGQPPQPVLPEADNVMFLHPGPDDSVLLSHGRNKKHLEARLWFPLDGVYTPIERGALGVTGRGLGAGELYWSEITRHVYFRYGSLRTVPEADVLSLKRVRSRGDGNIVPKT